MVCCSGLATLQANGLELSKVTGSEIFAQSDIFGSMKDTGNFLGRKKIQTEGFFWVAKKGLRDFFGCAKK